MGAPNKAVCSPWATEADLGSPCDDYAISASVTDDALSAASDVLFRLSGRQFAGLCDDTVRPCGSVRSKDWYPDRSYRGPFVGLYRNGRAGTCSCNRGSCGCSDLHAVSLGASPVTQITEVKVDGEVLDASAYRIDDYRFLVRTDGDGWPCCQNLAADSDEVGTFEVSFQYGVEPPQLGVQAAAALACELILAATPELVEKCRIPRQARSISRQGVSVDLVPLATFLEGAQTGIWEVDLFIKTYNPTNSQSRATVWSPDMGGRTRRVTG